MFKKRVVYIGILMTLFWGVPSVLYADTMEEETVSEAETEAADQNGETLKSNQRTAAIYIVEITGNELTYYEKDLPSGADETEDNADSGAGKPSRDFEMNMPKGDFGFPESGAEDAVSGASQEGGFSGKQPPQGDSQFPGDIGKGDFAGDKKPDFSSGKERPQGSFSPSGTGKTTTTVYLPVAAAVYGDNGEKRTFSILKAGDEAEAVFETGEDGVEVITELRLKS